MSGLLEVQLVDAHDLQHKDSFFGGKTDPYVLIQYKNHTLKSPVAKGQGSKPVWNEKFTLWVEYPESDGQYNLTLKIMDKDTFSKDDFLGETIVSVKDVVELGMKKGKAERQPCKYNVIGESKNDKAVGIGAYFWLEPTRQTQKRNAPLRSSRRALQFRAKNHSNPIPDE